MILCPKCGTRTNVYDSRISYEGTTRRKRLCPSCSHRFATIEVLDTERALHSKPGKPSKQKVEKPAKRIKEKPNARQGKSKTTRRPRDEQDPLDYSPWEEDFEEVVRDLGIDGIGRYD